jgi:glycosyltransferase involved in cell wall biosynthesis
MQEEVVLYTDNVQTEEPFASVQHLSWPFRYFWSEIRLSTEMIRHTPDILFVPGRSLPLIHPRHTISVIHDVGFLDDTQYRSKTGRAYLDYSTRFALRNSSQCIAVSEFTKQELVSRFHADPSRITVIPLGVDHHIYRRDISPQRVSAACINYALAQPYLITVGRIDHRKNISLLLRAFTEIKRLHPEYQLVIVGPCGFGAERIMEEIRAHVFAEDIKVVGWVGEEDKAALLAGASLFIFPSLYEGFGLPLLEAQAVGVPVVSSNSSSLPEVAGRGARFFHPHSVEECVQEILSVLASSQQAGDLVEKGFENVQRYSWERTAHETYALLKS